MYKENQERESLILITRSVDKWVSLRCSGSKGVVVCAVWILQPRFASRLPSRGSPCSLLTASLILITPVVLSNGGGGNRTPVLIGF